MRLAIIDIGTNTFNLLIADLVEKQGFNTVYKSNLPVKLGQGGINNKNITQEAFNRGVEAIQFHSESIKQYKADKIYAYATSAIRSTENGAGFVKIINEKFGIKINIISGDEEARLIYEGIKMAVGMSEKTNLIMDIGGGSVEFIIANNKEIFWKESFNLGIARLLDQFSPSDPIKKDEIKNIEKHLKDNLHSLFSEACNYNITKLLGSSGSFDTFASMVSFTRSKVDYTKHTISYKIEIEEYNNLHAILLNSTLQERANMEGLEAMRIEMIVLASILVNLIIKELNISQIVQSSYAIKEGVIFNILNKKQIFTL